MKFSFKFLFLVMLLTSTSYAREIIAIYYQSHNQKQKEKALVTARILSTNLEIPQSFINVSARKSPCNPRPDLIVQICFSEQDNELVFPVFKERIVKRTLAKFIPENMGGYND
jgi:hypothetical protein